MIEANIYVAITKTSNVISSWSSVYVIAFRIMENVWFLLNSYATSKRASKNGLNTLINSMKNANK